MRLRACVLGVTLALLLASPARATPWQPAPGTTWQIQFSGTLDTADYNVQAFDVDMFDTSIPQVDAIHAKPAKAICYIDAGSWERWRSDAKKYPKRVLGKPLAGWPGERWLDIRRINTIGPILGARVNDCAAKGFDAGLKNDLGQIQALVGDFDFAVNEQCVQYRECNRLKPFIDAGKAVFNIEYRGELSAICNVTQPQQLSTLKKHRSLDAYAEACPP